MALSDYFKTIDNISDREAQRLRGQVRTYYKQSLDNIQNELARLDRKGVLTHAQMNNYKRLQNLEAFIDKEIGNTAGRSTQTMKARFRSIYETSYYRGAYGLEKTAEAKLGFGLLKKEVIEEAILNPLDRVGFIQRNRENSRALARQLKQELTQGLVQGNSYSQIARSVSKRMNKGYRTSVRIVNTETHRIRETAKRRTMEEAQEYGVNMKKRWISTIDGVTRDSHEDLDGVTIPLEEDFEGEHGSGPGPGQMNSAREDINCRCTTIAIMEGYEPRVRRARENDDERGEIIGYQNYNEWKAGRIGS